MTAFILICLLLEVAAEELATGLNSTSTHRSDNHTLVFISLAEKNTDDTINVAFRSVTVDPEEAKNGTTGSILSLLKLISGPNVSTIIETALDEVNGTNSTEHLRSRSKAQENVTEVNYLPDDFVLNITNHKDAQLRNPSITVGKLKKVMAYRSLGARGKLNNTAIKGTLLRKEQLCFYVGGGGGGGGGAGGGGGGGGGGQKICYPLDKYLR